MATLSVRVAGGSSHQLVQVLQVGRRIAGGRSPGSKVWEQTRTKSTERELNSEGDKFAKSAKDGEVQVVMVASEGSRTPCGAVPSHGGEVAVVRIVAEESTDTDPLQLTRVLTKTSTFVWGTRRQESV